METLTQFTVERLGGDTESVYSENVRWRHWVNLQWKCEMEIVGQFTVEV